MKQRWKEFDKQRFLNILGEHNEYEDEIPLIEDCDKCVRELIGKYPFLIYDYAEYHQMASYLKDADLYIYLVMKFNSYLAYLYTSIDND
jgi:hypothetical protein